MRRPALLTALIATLALFARAQVPPVDYPAVCYGCHEKQKLSFNKKDVHKPVREGKCPDCHNPHAANHEHMLNTESKNLCVTCHDKLKDRQKEDNAHQPFKQGECLQCHEPHASDNEKLLKAPTSELCTGCHQKAADWLRQKYVHDPVSKRCNACHDPHSSPAGRLLKDTVPALCWTCHKQNAKIIQVHPKNFSFTVNCTKCHSPHASDLKNLIRPKEHKPFKEGKCEDCHAVTKGRLSTELKFPDAKDLCYRCHQEMAKYKEMPHKHIMEKPASCLQCHQSHNSDNDSLLRLPPSQLCVSCHLKDKSQKEREHFITHKGIECNRCHDPHGSQNEKILRAPGSELCLQCHKPHKGSHPFGNDVIDPRSGQPVTCRSCHQLHDADFIPYLPKNPRMELCIQCHQK